MPTTDEHLAAETLRGDSAAFEVLVRRYQVPLLRFLQRRLGARADAEDVLQETFVRAYTKLSTFDTRRRFKAWLFTIARNTAINYRRRLRLAVEEQPIEQIAVEPAHPALVADERERLWRVAREVLSDEQHEALWLHYVEQLQTAEIARVMGRSWVSVKTLLVRGRRRLLPHLRRDFDPHCDERIALRGAT